jgi:Carboxypeptidase regulatory-like domain
VVTAAGTLAPLAGVVMTLYALDTSDPPAEIMRETQTDAGGAYRFDGLPAGRYKVLTRNSLGYADELYGNIPCPAGYCFVDLFTGAGTPVDVALGATAGGVNFALDPGARVTGTITDAFTLTPLTNACVYVLRISSGFVTAAAYDCTDGAGRFDAGGLPAGTYYLRAITVNSSHVPALYGNIPCLAEVCSRQPAAVAASTPVVVATGATAAARDVALSPGGGISGVVSDASTLAPLAGIDVRGVVRAAGTAFEVVSATTDTVGGYVLPGLPGGTYYVYVSDAPRRGEIFDDIPCAEARCTEAELRTLGTPIAVAPGTVTTGIGFSLRRDVPPPAPDGLRASIAGFAVTLSWNRPEPGITRFLVEAGLSPGTTAVVLPTVNQSFVAAPVGPGRYYVRVRAENAYGTSAASNEIEVVVNAQGSAPPAAPPFIAGWMSGSRLTLTWTPPYVGGVATSYLVEAGAATGATSLTLPVTAPAFTYQPVPPGVYFVRVRAVNAAGMSPPSPEVRLHVGNVPAPPYAPENLQATASGGTVTFTWSWPFWQGVVTGHRLVAGSGPGLSNLAQVTLGAATQASFGGVPPGTYYVRVHALNAAGASIASDDVAVVVR